MKQFLSCSRITLGLLLCLQSTFLVIAPTCDADPAAETSLTPLTPAVLFQNIQDRVKVIPEFRLIRQFADSRGLRVWLAADSAASFAYGVKHDLLFNTGIFEDYSETDHTDLYRFLSMHQKATLVIDGSANDALELFQALEDAPYPYRTPTGVFWNIKTWDQYTSAVQLRFQDLFSRGTFEITERPSKPTLAETKILQAVIDNQNPVTHFKEIGFLDGCVALNQSMGGILKYLTHLARYQLSLPSEEEIKIRSIVDHHQKLGCEINTAAVYTLLFDAFDLPKTIAQAEKLGILGILYQQQAEFGKEPHFYFVQNLKHLGIHSFHPQRYRRYFSNGLKTVPDHSIIEGTFLYSGGRPYFFVDYQSGDFPKHQLNAQAIRAQYAHLPTEQTLVKLQDYTVQVGHQQRQPGFFIIPDSYRGKYDCRDRALLFHHVLSSADYPTYFFSTAPHTFNGVIDNDTHYLVDCQFRIPVRITTEPANPRYDFRVWVPAPEINDFHHPSRFVLPTPCGWLLNPKSRVSSST